MGERFADHDLGRVSGPLDLTHEHRALDDPKAIVGQSFLVDNRRQPSLRLFLCEEGSDLALYRFKDATKIDTDQIILLGETICDRSEWTGPRHPKSVLQVDVLDKPQFQVIPGLDVVLHRRLSGLDEIEMTFQDLMDQIALISEVVIKLTFSGSRGRDDLIGAGARDPLYMKQVE